MKIRFNKIHRKNVRIISLQKVVDIVTANEKIPFLGGPIICVITEFKAVS
jgi:hypothetical protein